MDDRTLLLDLFGEESIIDRPRTQFDENGALFSLDISGLGLVELPHLDRFTHLITLDAGYNRIESLSEDLFRKNRTLRELSLRSNKLSSVPEKLLDKQPYMQILSLAENSICKIPEMFFRRCVNLTHLHLNNNQLMELPRSLLSLKNLRFLDLQGNHLVNSPTLTSANAIHDFLRSLNL